MSSKYEKVFKNIENRIQNGIWDTGMLMPTENELCSLFDVSRITVRRALAELEKLGLVVRIQGKGSFVGKRRFHSTNCQGFRDSMLEQGIVVLSKILSSELIDPPPDIRVKLQLEENNKEQVWYFCRLRLVENIPVALMQSYIPKKIGDELIKHELNNTSLYRLITEITGKEIVDTKGAVTATTPTDSQCLLLQVKPGSAHIWYKSVGYLEDGLPVEASSCIFNAEMYEFSVRYEHLQSCVGRENQS